MKCRLNISPAKMSEDDDLERRAVQELLRETTRARARAETMGPAGWLKCPIRSTNKRFLLNTLRSTTLQRRPAGQPREQHSPAAERQRPRGEESDSDSGRDRTGGSAVAAAARHREGKERGHKRDSIKERSPPRRHSESSHCGSSPPRRHSSHCGSSPEGYSGRHPMTSSHRPHSHSRSRSRSPVRGRNSAHNSSSSAADKHSHSTSHK